MTSETEDIDLNPDLMKCILDCSEDDFCSGLRMDDDNQCTFGPNVNDSVLDFIRLDSYLILVGPPLIDEGTNDGSNQLMINLTPFEKQGDILSMDFYAGSDLSTSFKLHIFTKSAGIPNEFKVRSTIEISDVKLGLNYKEIGSLQVNAGEYYGLYWYNWVVKKTIIHDAPTVNTGMAYCSEMSNGDSITIKNTWYREYRMQLTYKTGDVDSYGN